MKTKVLLTPRFETAKANPPGNPDFWRMMLDQSDNFAFETSSNGPDGYPKGGPFGAQLWLAHPTDANQNILVGTAERLEDSNAVVSKGLLSAHAEAENLNPENRAKLIAFLREHQGEGWQVVQVSSGESCQSCHSKQTLLADELMNEGLIEPDGFSVIYKASFAQTLRDAKFHDEPYDQCFRAIFQLGVLDQPDGLVGLAAALDADAVTKAEVAADRLIYTPVNETPAANLPDNVDAFFKENPDRPVAIIVSADGEILGKATDTRDQNTADMNEYERTAIASAIVDAAEIRKRKNEVLHDAEKIPPWSLTGAKLYTNIRSIGPLGYAESLWGDMDSIEIVPEYGNETVELMAQERPGKPNHELFADTCREYDDPASPIKARYAGNPDEAAAAHLNWKARLAREAIWSAQQERISGIRSTGMTHINLIDGGAIPLEAFVQTGVSSHYDGATTNAPPADAPAAEA